MIEPTKDSYRSALIPATSPTLSPTLSAITAGLRASSSGISISNFPTKSAPTSAALVKIPPATRLNSAMDEAPNPKPARESEAKMSVSVGFWPECPRVKENNTVESPNMPSPTTIKPATDPPVKATRRAEPSPPLSAAFAVRTLASVAATIPPHPETADKTAPKKKETAYRIPVSGWPTLRANNRRTIPTTKNDKYLYSVIRKARAPDLIWSETRFMA
mmetsp:Transcript_9934/g.24776  ORF Transcript_9934/g.24776 Transcript_9934/m.24776 type:complete len:218 (-) Transcript_9934:370-1023(-)